MVDRIVEVPQVQDASTLWPSCVEEGFDQNCVLLQKVMEADGRYGGQLHSIFLLLLFSTLQALVVEDLAWALVVQVVLVMGCLAVQVDMDREQVLAD